MPKQGTEGESESLRSARQHLRAVEAAFTSPEAALQLESGLDLLEATAGSDEWQTAASLGRTYTERFASLIAARIEARDVPEPELKHLLKISRILGRSTFADAGRVDIPALTIDVANRFIDAMFEGYPPEEKQRELERIRNLLMRQPQP